MQKKLLLTALALMTAATTSFTFERFSNYTSTLTVNDFAFRNDTVWAATSGGLLLYKRGTGSVTIYSNPTFFPDPALKGVCLDTKNGLWIGSQNGYLTYRSPNGAMKTYANYAMAGWGITDLAVYDRFLIVASDKGCSVFDTEKKIAVKNATGLGVFFQSPQVNASVIYGKANDTFLVLGGEKGVARLPVTNKNLEKANFYDPGIWSIDTASGVPVRAFARKNDSLLSFSTPTAMVNGQVISSAVKPGTRETDPDTGILLVDSVRKLDLSSVIRCLAESPSGECFIGTTYNHFYVWNGIEAVHVPLGGPTFTMVYRVHYDREGMLWAGQQISSSVPQSRGFSSYSNGKWRLYTPAEYPQMGSYISDGPILGVTEDRFGRIWFATHGGQAKRYNRVDGSWQKYCIGAQDFGKGEFFPSTYCHAPDWAKINSIAQDSSGFLWFASWQNRLGWLLAYDPAYDPAPTAADHESRHYRYFYPESDPYYFSDMGFISVDAANNIIVADGNEGIGRILVLRHNGNPLRDGLRINTDFSDQNRGITYDMAATNDTLTYIATTSGFYTYSAPGNTLRKGLCVRSWIEDNPILTTIDTALSDIRAVEVEDRRFLWLGTANKGLIRYDLFNNTSTVIDQSSGLLSNTINDLSIDRKNGSLWIATNRGVSRYSMGYAVSGNTTASAQVYPNPWSKRRHREIVFEKLPVKSTVQVYSVSGTLIATLIPVDSGTRGSVCVWKPSTRTVPGMYLYTIRSESSTTRGKLIITP
ncbi:MAG: T9SS type A sorting domain-containing protein [Chitinispirillaceae bacterium]|nr:T9SS type A sorting domain-containing protein [Chitinispirillaceae bacterium]